MARTRIVTPYASVSCLKLNLKFSTASVGPAPAIIAFSDV
jgi:hypothetical protein